MDYQDAISFLKSTKNKGSVLGLERIRELLSLMGNPEKKCNFIHVAGTNGKGSVSLMLSEILKAAGYKTGLFTSPFLYSFEEQIRINGENISQQSVISIANKMQTLVSEKKQSDGDFDLPTEFEMITAMAFEYFAESHCDIVILEVGMGGIEDATNVIESSVLDIIVSIAMDHSDFLGKSLGEIAKKKAGIIKENATVISAPQQEEVLKVLFARAKETRSEIRILPSYTKDGVLYPENLTINSIDLFGQNIDYAKYTDIFIPLIGNYQARNAAIVLEAVTALNNKNFSLSIENVREGMNNAKWPGRFEIISRNPLFIVDGAHNPHGVQALVENIRTYLPDKKVTFITGILADKDYMTMLEMTIPYARKYYTITPDNPRALSGMECAKILTEKGIDAEYVSSIKEAVLQAKKVNLANENDGAMEQTGNNVDQVIIAFGSLYSMKDLRG